MSQKKFDPLHRIEEAPSRLCVILAILTLAAHVIICSLTPAKPAALGLVLIIAYLTVSSVIYFIARKKFNIFKIQHYQLENRKSYKKEVTEEK